jgi:hypothetical protein
VLTNDEILRLKGACGYNVVGIGAEAYSGMAGYVALFDRAVQPYLIDQSTTSSTAVTAAPGGAAVSITLAANPPAPGNNVQPLTFALQSKIVVDIGPSQETSVIQSITGLVIVVTLANAHGTLGSYLVEPWGAEYQVRAYLTRLDAINAQLDTFAPLLAGVQEAVGDAKFYGSRRGGRQGSERNKFDDLIAQREQARRDLCGVLGIPYLADVRKRRGQSFEPF